MHKFKFTPDDLFINRLKTYPEYSVFIYEGRMYVNKEGLRLTGGIDVYDINRNLTQGRVFPFVVSSSEKNAFKSQRFQPLVQSFSGDNFFISKYAEESGSSIVDGFYGESFTTTPGESSQTLTSSYSFASPITRNKTARQSTFTTTYYNLTASDLRTETLPFTKYGNNQTVNVSASALQNVARKYAVLSDHFIFISSSTRSRDLVYGADADNINFLTIPSMYYGSTIKKGSVELNYFITGSMLAACADINHDGTLIGTTGSTSGSVVGLVLYDEGVIMLTSSVAIDLVAKPAGYDIHYNGASQPEVSSSWQFFGTTLNDGITHSSTTADNMSLPSYELKFKGVNYVDSMTMFAHARKGHLNHSNNPSYRNLSTTRVNQTGSGLIFAEGPSDIANIVSGSHVSASFDKTTYISKVHIYDEDGNLIAITSLAKPIKKTLEDEFTFKMKLDL